MGGGGLVLLGLGHLVLDLLDLPQDVPHGQAVLGSEKTADTGYRSQQQAQGLRHRHRTKQDWVLTGFHWFFDARCGTSILWVEELLLEYVWDQLFLSLFGLFLPGSREEQGGLEGVGLLLTSTDYTGFRYTRTWLPDS